MGDRFDLDAAATPKREGLGSGWSQKKKMIVGGVCAVVAVGAVSAGVIAMIANTPPGMPKTAAEAVEVMGSAKFDRLDKDRKGQYAAEAGRLLGELDDEARRELLRGRENREAMRNMMMETMDQNARRFAKGEEMVWPDFGWGRRGNGEGRPQRPQREEMTEEEREARRKERMERFNQMMRDQIGSGNSQDSALRGEMFQRMMSGGGGFPGRGGRGGGGRGGGGGGGGRGGGGGGAVEG